MGTRHGVEDLKAEFATVEAIRVGLKPQAGATKLGASAVWVPVANRGTTCDRASDRIRERYSRFKSIRIPLSGPKRRTPAAAGVIVTT